MDTEEVEPEETIDSLKTKILSVIEERDKYKNELDLVKETFSRRDALDDIPTLSGKAAKACEIAGQAEQYKRDYERSLTMEEIGGINTRYIDSWNKNPLGKIVDIQVTNHRPYFFQVKLINSEAGWIIYDKTNCSFLGTGDFSVFKTPKKAVDYCHEYFKEKSNSRY